MNSFEQYKQQRREQVAFERFAKQLAECYPVVQVDRIRCPTCGAVATGRPQHSERDGELSVQRRKCAVCETMFISIIS